MSRTIPFTLLEEMTLHLDRRLQPLNMQGEVETSATIDVDRLRAATRTAIDYHPLAGARRRESTPVDSAFEWVLSDDPEPAPVVEVDAAEVDLQTVRNRLYTRRFDLTGEPPFRLVVVRGGGIDGGDHLLQSTSHVAADGVGALRLGDAVCTAYRGEEPMRDTVGLPESRSLLRDLESPDLSNRVQGIDSLTRRLRESVLDPTDLATDGGSDREGWGYARRYLDADLTTRLVRDRPDGVSVNDVLLAALHLAMAEWNDDHGKVTGRLSVMMPVNLRPPAWFYQVMAMYTMFESVRTGRSHRRNPRETVERVAEQTTRIKERDRAASLFKAVALLPRSTPVALKRRLPDILRGPGRRLTDTVLLTNLGNIPGYPSLGADTEERVFLSPPTWEATPVGFGVATVDGRVNLFCRYLLRQFDEAAGERFVDTYVEQIERLIETELPAMAAD
jgi:NRPS condensation-like uncharacterized protein